MCHWFRLCVWDVKYSAHCAASPGGTGHLRTRARVSQRITNSVELLPTTPAIQWQVRAIKQQMWQDHDRIKSCMHLLQLCLMWEMFTCVPVFLNLSKLQWILKKLLCLGSAVQTVPPCVEIWRISIASSRDFVWLWRNVLSK